MGTQVQQKIAFSATSNTTISVTLDSAPTSGNLLITYLTVDKSSGAITVPTGFTLVLDQVNADCALAMAYKISDGSETTITWNFAAARSYKQTQYLEYSGLDTLDVYAEANSGTSNVTSQTSGTTGTTAQSSAHAFALFSSDSKGNTDAGVAFTNGFTSTYTYTEPGSINTGTSGLYSAEKVLSATGTQETTFSTTGAGDQMIGAIAVFYLAGGGGGGGSNGMYYHAQQ
jgi:hypothetical protein